MGKVDRPRGNQAGETRYVRSLVDVEGGLDQTPLLLPPGPASGQKTHAQGDAELAFVPGLPHLPVTFLEELLDQIGTVDEAAPEKAEAERRDVPPVPGHRGEEPERIAAEVERRAEEREAARTGGRFSGHEMKMGVNRLFHPLCPGGTAG